jgi:hypothetical protein
MLHGPSDPGRRSSSLRAITQKSLTMWRIIQTKIDRFNALLKTETNPTKRALEQLVLAEQKARKGIAWPRTTRKKPRPFS